MTSRLARARQRLLRALNLIRDCIPSFNPQFVALLLGGVVGGVLVLIISSH